MVEWFVNEYDFTIMYGVEMVTVMQNRKGVVEMRSVKAFGRLKRWLGDLSSERHAFEMAREKKLMEVENAFEFGDKVEVQGGRVGTFLVNNGDMTATVSVGDDCVVCLIEEMKLWTCG